MSWKLTTDTELIMLCCPWVRQRPRGHGETGRRVRLYAYTKTDKLRVEISNRHWRNRCLSEMPNRHWRMVGFQETSSVTKTYKYIWCSEWCQISKSSAVLSVVLQGREICISAFLFLAITHILISACSFIYYLTSKRRDLKFPHSTPKKEMLSDMMS